MGFDQCEKDAKIDAEQVKRRLASGDYVLVAPATKAKSEVWKSYVHVYNENNEPVGYIAGRTISERRNALKPSTVDSIIFLHKNMQAQPNLGEYSLFYIKVQPFLSKKILVYLICTEIVKLSIGKP